MNLSNPLDPASYPRRALVCLVGLSPQVVTETLYALALRQEERFVPTELHIVTTALGAVQVRAQLLDSCMLRQLLQEHLQGSVLDFDPQRHLHLIEREGVALDDIETALDNTAVADTVLRLLRPLLRDPDCAVHASIAGGRKSMGFYLGYVLSLLGRPQDRLSHVLVNAPFESHPGFFFPPAAPHMLALRGGGEISTAQARIVLAPVAFVRMADGLGQQLQRDDTGFEELVHRAQQALTPVQVTLLASRRQVKVHGAGSVTLEPSLMAWYLYFALRRQRALREDTRLAAPGMVMVHKQASRSIGLDQRLLDTACDRVGVERQDAALAPADLRSRISPINKALLRGFGSDLGGRLQISGPADRGVRDGQYGLLRLAPDQISFG